MITRFGRKYRTLVKVVVLERYKITGRKGHIELNSSDPHSSSFYLHLS